MASAETLLGEAVLELQGAKIEVVSVQAGLRLLLRSRDLREMQRRLDRTRHTFSNAVLEVEDIAAVTVKAVGPDLRARGRIDELSGDAKAIATAPDTALQHIPHAELAPHLAHIDCLASIGERRIARDHEQRAAARKRDYHLLRHAVGEVVLLWVSAHVGERQHGDGGLVRKSQGGLRRLRGNLLARDLARLGLLPHRTDKTDPLARKCLDQTLRLAAVSNRAAHRVDARRQRCFRDYAPLPDGLGQVGLADHAGAVTDQQLQKIEGLWLDRDKNSRAAQLTPACVESEIFEPAEHRPGPAARSAQ